MSDYLETEHVLRSAGYRVTMHDSGVSFEDTANPGEAVHLEPGDDAVAAQELSLALKFAQRRMEILWRELRAKADAGRKGAASIPAIDAGPVRPSRPARPGRPRR